MTDYAVEIGGPGAWQRVRGAFTIPNACTSRVLVDPDQPDGPTREITYDLQFPEGWLENSTADERAMFKIKAIAPADSPPEGADVIDFEIFDNNGSPKYRAVLRDA